MADNVAVPAQASPQTTATGPVENVAESDDRVAKLESAVSTLTKTLNGLAAAQRVAQKAQPAAQQDPEQNLTLRSLKAELDTRDSKLREKAIRTEVKAWAKTQGISDESRPFIEAYIREQYQAQLTVDENDEVVWTDEFGERKPFAELGKKVLSSSGGQTFQQPVATPGAVGNRTRNGVNQGGIPGVKPIIEWTAEDYQKNPDAGLAQLRAAYRQSQGM